MIVLGIDPGIARVGWGVLSSSHSKLSSISYGCITTSVSSADEVRLKNVYDEITTIISSYHPDVISIEKLFFAANAKTAFVVGQARGVLLLSAANAGIDTFSYTPLEVKMALTGYGKADKSQIQRMVQSILTLPSIPKPDDTADALAIAITHCAIHRTYNTKL